MLTWHFITRNAYDFMDDALKTLDKLFFIKDDNSILNGTNTFNEDIILYNRYPTTIINGRIYININTLEGLVCVGNNWDTVINPTIIDRSDYIRSEDIDSVVYNSEYNNLTIIKIDGTEDTVELADLTLDINYSNGIFTIVNQDCYLSYGRKIILSDFIDSIIFNDNKLFIMFKQSNNQLSINIESIMNTENDINFTITGNSFIAECLLYDNSSNEIYKSDDIYVIYRHNTDISSIVVNDTIHNIVAHLSTIVNTSLSFMTTVGFDKSGEILLADDEGNASASGVTIIESVSDYPKDNHIPTEQAIVEYMDENVIVKSDITTYEEFKKLNEDTATDRRLASELTLLKQMSWDII